MGPRIKYLIKIIKPYTIFRHKLKMFNIILQTEIKILQKKIQFRLLKGPIVQVWIIKGLSTTLGSQAISSYLKLSQAIL